MNAYEIVHSSMHKIWEGRQTMLLPYIRSAHSKSKYFNSHQDEARHHRLVISHDIQEVSFKMR